jgi:hypothetical protein
MSDSGYAVHQNKVPVRRSEKRRTSTCQFADRVAKISIEHYRKYVPFAHQTQTCMAAIVAHSCEGEDSIVVLGMVSAFLTEIGGF